MLANAMNALAVAGTAAERYRGAHGHWPSGLSDLVPTQLTQVPLDPFAEGQTLSFVSGPSGAQRLVIYSVGPDRVDDGARPRDPVSGRGDLLYPLD